MKKYISFFFILFFSFHVSAQYSLRLIVTDATAKKWQDIFVAGDFNSWNPGDLNYKLKPFGGARMGYVFKNIPPGVITFKFTRGSWDKVETTASGNDVENHAVSVNSDTSIEFSIAGWKDDFPSKPKLNTASAQVQVLDTAFFMPQLNRYRRIWIYFPKNYTQSTTKKYPVIYFNDGQNLFNEQTAAFGEWGIDECLDTLQQQLHKDVIVVGIDNGSDKRMTEYNPYDNEKFGKGEGKQYADFLALTLKPFIDKKFRTLADAHHTCIAGSSMGALISLYAVMAHPESFGEAGIFSPAFWVVPQMFTDVEKIKWGYLPRFYFYAGGKESDSMVTDMERMYKIIENKNNYDMQEDVNSIGMHNEKYWREEFPLFYKWLMK